MKEQEKIHESLSKAYSGEDNNNSLSNRSAEALKEYEKKMTTLENRLYEERFIWVIISIVLFDALIFTNMKTWAGPLIIGVFELIFVYVAANRLGVDSVAPLIDRFTGLVHRAAKTEKSG